MSETERNHHPTPSKIYTFAVIAALLWTVALIALFSWNVASEKDQTENLAIYQARAFFQGIVTTRYWNAAHGGVYVPITEKTQPNPYLDDPGRDVMTTNGLALTKINPAYMTRQIGELTSKRNFVRFHITSTNPIRPANAPDPWERGALETFSSRSAEYFEFTDAEDGTSAFRYMAPLMAEKPCLKCHAKQGYKEGDLRGGISVTIKADPFVTNERNQIAYLATAYVAIWFFGLQGIGLGMIRLKKEETKREAVVLQLQDALAEVNTLSGLLPICASCKKIRDDKGYWNHIESYIEGHSEAQFSHGICPECVVKLYPEIGSDDGNV